MIMVGQVHLIDFGLPKRYRDTTTHQHIPYSFIFLSLSRFEKREQKLNRNCTVCKLQYSSRNCLPWQGLKAETKKQKYNKICEKKLSTPIEVLCKSHPVEFASYFHYCHSLTFDRRPDYGFLKRLLHVLFTREGFEFDYVFDWTILKYKQKQRTKPPAKSPVIYSNLLFLKYFQ
ncbi:hypothetical protein NC651_038288 [Populus alba x Populus x berolinensis]|nr:hypothetical protein NC651_038288 [Populus alba x Populus x berolinensis]